MIVLVAVLGCGLVAGLAAAAVAIRWPAHDPAAPRLGASGSRRAAIGLRHLDAALHRHVEPDAATAVVLVALFAVVALTTVLAGLLHLAATTDALLGRTDGPLAEWAADNADAGVTTVVRELSRFGGSPLVIGAALVVGLVERRRIPAPGLVPFLVVAVGGQFALVNLVKVVIDRSRPELLQLTGFAGASFPSGHAAAAAAGFASFALLLGRGRSIRVRALLAGAAAGIAGTVAATRVALGVHWFTDVLAGLVVGWGWFAASALAFGGRALRFGDPAR